MALSVTYSPDRRLTKAVLYGCTDDIRDTMISRLTACNQVIYHPLAIPTLFCDIERKRHFDLVEPAITKLVNSALNIAKPQPLGSVSLQSTSRGSSASADQASASVEDPENLMKVWLQVSDLKRGLETWRRQLENLILHCEDLGRAQPRVELDTDPVNSDLSHDFDKNRYLESGRCVYHRLVELRGEYDEKIRQCTDIVDGMVLAAQLVCYVSFLLLPLMRYLRSCLIYNNNQTGMEQHWTARYTDQPGYFGYELGDSQSYTGRFSTDAFYIVSHHGLPTSHLRCRE